MAVEDWIDEVCKLWEISDGRGGTVRSYRAFEKAEFPEALTEYPCALTYVTEVENQYSLGGPCIDYWRGVTEIHVAEGVDKSKFPDLMRYFARVRDAAASNLTLNGKVAYFTLMTGEGPSVRGPVTLQYGSEAPHLGLVVSWVVKESVSFGVEAGVEFKEYIALISQAGTSTPTATVIKNDTGATVTYTYDGVGSYTAHFGAPVLTTGKSISIIEAVAANRQYASSIVDNSSVHINTATSAGGAADGTLGDSPFIVRIYV